MTATHLARFFEEMAAYIRMRKEQRFEALGEQFDQRDLTHEEHAEMAQLYYELYPQDFPYRRTPYEIWGQETVLTVGQEG